MSENLRQTSRYDRPIEPLSTPVARHFPVKYSFSGVQREMAQTFALAPDEQPITTGLITVRRLGIMGGPGLVLLTDRRLCLLVHYFFRTDQGFEFPRGSLTGVRRIDLIPTVWFLRLSYRTTHGLAHLDISDVQARSLATDRMGRAVRAQHLFEAIQRAWGSQAPVFEAP